MAYRSLGVGVFDAIDYTCPLNSTCRRKWIVLNMTWRADQPLQQASPSCPQLVSTWKPCQSVKEPCSAHARALDRAQTGRGRTAAPNQKADADQFCCRFAGGKPRNTSGKSRIRHHQWQGPVFSRGLPRKKTAQRPPPPKEALTLPRTRCTTGFNNFRGTAPWWRHHSNAREICSTLKAQDNWAITLRYRAL